MRGKDLRESPDRGDQRARCCKLLLQVVPLIDADLGPTDLAGACKHHDVEIEDLLPLPAIDRIVIGVGFGSIDGIQRCGKGFHRLPL